MSIILQFGVDTPNHAAYITLRRDDGTQRRATMTATEKRRATMAERKATRERLARIHAENAKVVAGGVCPCCGAKLKRNLALTGWWMCEQRGAVGFRKDASKPSCEFQCFTE